MMLRDARAGDLEALLAIEKQAFGRDDEAELVKHLLTDESAKPLLSLLAVKGNESLGHVLFTKASLKNSVRDVKASILAPLAVLPKAQGQGIGGLLIREGLRRLAVDGIELVFVLGHPKYYTRHGFEPAGHHGFDAPYSIPEKDADAWMVKALKDDVLGSVKGQVVCADALNHEEYWQE